MNRASPVFEQSKTSANCRCTFAIHRGGRYSGTCRKGVFVSDSEEKMVIARRGHADHACLDYCLSSGLLSAMSTIEYLHSLLLQSTLQGPARQLELEVGACHRLAIQVQANPQCQLNPDINELSGTQKGREL